MAAPRSSMMGASWSRFHKGHPTQVGMPLRASVTWASEPHLYNLPVHISILRPRGSAVQVSPLFLSLHLRLFSLPRPKPRPVLPRDIDTLSHFQVRFHTFH